MKTSDYFTNHGRAAHWPFTLYHRPIENDLAAFIQKRIDLAKEEDRRLKGMVFGCGLFHEAEVFKDIPELLLVDADPRLEAPLKEKLQHRSGVDFLFADTAEAFAQQIQPGSIDFIIGKEVIEHIEEPQPYYAQWRRALRTGGRLWLSTPNYGAYVLPLIESTFLEGVARLQGFSRQHIHPNKYSQLRLKNELIRAGFNDVTVTETPLKLALCAHAAG